MVKTFSCCIILQTPCSKRPCKNGGKCIALYERNNFKCTCPSGFKGMKCEQGKLLGFLMLVSDIPLFWNIICYLWAKPTAEVIQMNLRKCRRDDTQTGTVISRSARRGSEALLFVGFYSQMALSLNGSLLLSLSLNCQETSGSTTTE